MGSRTGQDVSLGMNAEHTFILGRSKEEKYEEGLSKRDESLNEFMLSAYFAHKNRARRTLSSN
jgi:hypothetical protein